MNSPVIVALDYPHMAPALALAEQLSPRLCRVKVGKELFTRCGPAVVESLQKLGFDVFLDLKFHDIPTTVAGALRAAAELGVWMVNVHSSGGRRMLLAAADALHSATQRPLLIGVTLLTSLSQEDLSELGDTRSMESRVLSLAALSQDCGLDGVVCSAMETSALRQSCGDTFCLVTPGIRLAGDASDDQRRVVTPGEAIALGSDYLVIGRSITAAADPLAALQRVHSELSA